MAEAGSFEHDELIDTEALPPGFNLDPPPVEKGEQGERGFRGFEGPRGAPGKDAVIPTFTLEDTTLVIKLDDLEIARQDLKGEQGRSVEFRWEGTQLQCRIAGDEEWQGVDLQGPAGRDGKDGIDGEHGKDGLRGADGRDGKDGARGARGPKGEKGKDGRDGKDGEKGEKGDPPKHEIAEDGTKIRFENPDGSWGEWIDFKKLIEKLKLPGGRGGMGPMGPRGDNGAPGPAGAPGPGLPAGGATGQSVRKRSSADYDFEFFTPEGGGGAGENPNIVTMEAGQTLSALRIVRVDHDSSGVVTYADKDAIDDAEAVVGMTLASATSGQDVDVITSGVYEDVGWSWDVNANSALYLGDNGAIVQTPPSGAVLLRIGSVLTATKIIIRIGIPIITLN